MSPTVKRSAVSSSPTDRPTVDDAPILHVDLDAFFASVEILDDPTLAGRPIAVGGAGERGVIASASYEARRFGVRSGMPSVLARRRCPAMVILPGRFDRYEEYSRRFRDIVTDLTPMVEAIGLDELFADLRGLRRLGTDPVAAGWALRGRIENELHLDCGVGLARNKLFAKLASKRSKPSVVNGRITPGAGVVWVDPATERRWLAELPVEALWGVGPATAAKLHRLGLRWVRDLGAVDESTLATHVGPSMAATLVAYAHGDDRREVVVDRGAKSLGHDETFAKSLRTLNEVQIAARGHAAVVARALRAHHQLARTITLVVRFDDLRTVSRSQTLSFGVDDDGAIAMIGAALAETVELTQSVRLVGLYASSFLERGAHEIQLTLPMTIEAPSAREGIEAATRARQVGYEALRDAIDEVRQRFGRSAVGTVAELDEHGLQVASQRGRNAFGPDAGPPAT